MLIGEVAARSGLSVRMLRHYDALGLVRPGSRTDGGYRTYDEEDLRRLLRVEGLRALGLSLQEVADALADRAGGPASMVEELLARTRERLARDQELLGRLEQVRDGAPEQWSDVLRTVGLLRGLSSGSASARQRTVLALPGQGGDEAVALARAVLEEADPVVAGSLLWALARAGDAGVPVLVEALGAAAPERRRRAVAALARTAPVAAADALAAAVGDPDPVVATRAALVRGAAGDADAVPVLVAAVADGRDDVEAAGVLGALASGPEDRAQEVAAALGEALVAARGEGGAGARQRLAGALAEVPGPAATALLAGLVDDADRGVALTAGALLRARPV